MDEPISARYEWNAEAFADALEIHRRLIRTWIDRLILWIVPGLLVLVYSVLITVALVAPGLRSTQAKFIGGLTVIFGTLGAVFYRTFWSRAPRRQAARRAFRQLPSSSQVVQWEFADDQVSVSTELTKSTYLWPFFIKVVESPTAFLLYQTGVTFQWIPAHGFASASELRRFADLARSRVTQYIVLGECQFPTKPEPVVVDEL